MQSSVLYDVGALSNLWLYNEADIYTGTGAATRAPPPILQPRLHVLLTPVVLNDSGFVSIKASARLCHGF